MVRTRSAYTLLTTSNIFCPECRTPAVLDEHEYVCPKCGLVLDQHPLDHGYMIHEDENGNMLYGIQPDSINELMIGTEYPEKMTMLMKILWKIYYYYTRLPVRFTKILYDADMIAKKLFKNSMNGRADIYAVVSLALALRRCGNKTVTLEHLLELAGIVNEQEKTLATRLYRRGLTVLNIDPSTGTEIYILVNVARKLGYRDTHELVKIYHKIRQYDSSYCEPLMVSVLAHFAEEKGLKPEKLTKKQIIEAVLEETGREFTKPTYKWLISRSYEIWKKWKKQLV